MNFPAPTRRVVTVSDEALAERCAKGRIVLIDDHEEVLQALTNLLSLEGYACDGYPSAIAYLAWLKRNEPVFPGPSCILSDMRLPGLDGLELLGLLGGREDMPLILMSGASGIREAVQGFRTGAVDFLVKPVETDELLGAVTKALAISAQAHDRRARGNDIAERLASLTPREETVAARVAQGETNAQIAAALCISLRSVKRIRQSAALKLGATSTAELVLKFTDGSRRL
ncbi:response regulator transcription factor [Acidovorax sp. RAC01]|uniref:response regulator transcription factor n=1 Tax=Acidovorax sp. RAC01 TaxID=1842533 RepID=UPI0008552C7A|nr:response regulator [Acidovorax sp. RAC01]AOG21820.1 bacterial regulatory s, luxR family protein [Acidovorax sp. RAC01]